MTRSSQIPVVLLDVNLQSLALVRALGRRGIPVIGVVSDGPRFEHRSRYVEIVRTPESGPAALLTALAEIASRPGPAPLLVPTSDDMVLFASSHRHILARDFRFQMPPHDVLTGLVSKDGMARLADSAEIPQPGCWNPADSAELREMVPEMRFPVLLKPRYSFDWQRPEVKEIVPGKVASVDDPDRLIALWTALQDVGSEVVIQEEIPGDDTHLVYYVGYFDEDSRPLASFTGSKLRTLPIHYGSASAAEARRNDDVIELSERFMGAIGYRGHVGIEYKVDPRDGVPRLIEVNARWGLWDGLGGACGMDFADLNYRYLTRGTVDPVEDFREGHRWICFRRDLWSVGDYCTEGVTTRGDWLRQLATRSNQWAVWAADDPAPFLWSSCELLQVLASVGFAKLVAPLRLNRSPGRGVPVPVPAKR